MDELCIAKTMTLFDWLELAATLGVDGVEMYPGFFRSFEPEYLARVKTQLVKHGLEAPMMCASPDFTTPDARIRRAAPSLANRRAMPSPIPAPEPVITAMRFSKRGLFTVVLKNARRF
jgi:sugar phosphate isomerase/epimerase